MIKFCEYFTSLDNTGPFLGVSVQERNLKEQIISSCLPFLVHVLKKIQNYGRGNGMKG